MDYHAECRAVVEDVKNGTLSVKDAFIKLEAIEDRAYEFYPSAEPDGDITYCIAVTCEEIENL